MSFDCHRIIIKVLFRLYLNWLHEFWFSISTIHTFVSKMVFWLSSANQLDWINLSCWWWSLNILPYFLIHQKYKLDLPHPILCLACLRSCLYLFFDLRSCWKGESEASDSVQNFIWTVSVHPLSRNQIRDFNETFHRITFQE